MPLHMLFSCLLPVLSSKTHLKYGPKKPPSHHHRQQDSSLPQAPSFPGLSLCYSRGQSDTCILLRGLTSEAWGQGLRLPGALVGSSGLTLIRLTHLFCNMGV